MLTFSLYFSFPLLPRLDFCQTILLKFTPQNDPYSKPTPIIPPHSFSNFVRISKLQRRTQNPHLTPVVPTIHQKLSSPALPANPPKFANPTKNPQNISHSPSLSKSAKSPSTPVILARKIRTKPLDIPFPSRYNGTNELLMSGHSGSEGKTNTSSTQKIIKSDHISNHFVYGYNIDF